MALATRFVQPMDYYGAYKTNSWAGYTFKETLGYTSGRHTGVDYNGPGAGNADLGMQVRAIANGTVVAIENKTSIGMGLSMIVKHDLGAVLRRELGCDSLYARYMHLKAVHVSVGQEVTIATGIAELGNSGTVWAHLHLDLYKNTIGYGGIHWNYDKDTELQSYVDPFEFIEAHLSESEPNASVLEPYQRMVGAVGVNHRTAPNTSAALQKSDANPDGEWSAGEILDFGGYVKGEEVSGYNIWFVGRYSGGYLWSGAFTDPTTRGLLDLSAPDPNTPATPETPPVIEKPAPAMFAPDSALVTRVIPSPNFIANEQVPKFILQHQWGKPEDNFTVEGVVSGFLAEDKLAPHYVVSDAGIVQMVQEKYRAQHGGAEGNDGIGIEYDPNGSEAMYALGRALEADIRTRWNNIPSYPHSKFVNTECPKYIDLERLKTPAPPDPTAVETRLAKLEAGLATVQKFLMDTFKGFKP